MSSSTRVPFRSAALGGLLVAAAAGCTGAGPERASGIDAATGAVLADAADRLAVALDGDDPCPVLAEADALVARVRDAEAEGAPPQILAETTRVARAVTAEVACDRDLVPTDVEAGAAADDALEAPDATDGPATGGPVEAAEVPAREAGRTGEEVDADRSQSASNGNGNGDARGNGNSNADANGAARGGGPPPGRGGRG